jgi:RNA polymerase sigma-70 factor (ECF subfamily)
MYLLMTLDHGSWTRQEERVSPVRSLLDQLQARHADNFGWALTCCGWRRDMAEDALQEAYLRVLDGRANFSGRATPKTWFFAVIRRVAADMQRAGKRRAILNMRVVAGDGEATDTDDATASTDAIYADETSRRLQAAMMQLSSRQREVLHLVFYAEMTLEEAAATLDIALGSARTHYHRGKERLAQLLELEREHA